MREIKFRAWDKEHKILLNDITIGTISFYGTLNLALKHTEIMQYTGLKDKNGVEIYEGDIIITEIYDKEEYFKDGVLDKEEFYEENPIEEVIFSNHCWCLKRKDGTISESENFHEYINNIEVIGNIHENKELLEGK